MTTETPPPPPPPPDTKAAPNAIPNPNAAAQDAAHREAVQYWGYLIKDDKCGTAIFDRLLKGIARFINDAFPSHHDVADLTPSQLAAFYKSVGGDYDVLFVETPSSSISFIYRSLGAFHSLQPSPDDDGYSAPCVPALKARGFVTWQTIQLLLGPEEHVPFLQKAVEQYDIKDPETGETFLKILPKECFPDKPDDAMEQWYMNVAERLKREAESDANEKVESTRVRVEIDDQDVRTSSEFSEGDERHGAANYFSDPLYRKSRPRPPYVRHYSKQPTYVEDRTGGVVGRVRHMLNPFSSRHRENERRRASDGSLSDQDATPLASVPPNYPPPHQHPERRHHFPMVNHHKRPHPPRREDSLSSTDSDSDSDGPPSRHRTPIIRQRRSHEPISPREYFPSYFDERERRYSHDITPSERVRIDAASGQPIYGPTKAPPFAAQVAHIQASSYLGPSTGYARRSSVEPRPASYVRDGRGGHGVRYERVAKSAEPSPPFSREHSRDYDPGSSSSFRRSDRDRNRDWERDRRRSDEYSRDRDRDRDKDRDRDRDRDRGRDRDGRDRSGSDRSRVNDRRERLKDEWDERDRSPRDRDSRVRGARHVAGVEGGVGGRRYPVEQSWR